MNEYMNEAWKEYAADFNAMTDDEIEEETRRAQREVDEAESWLEAVFSWEVAGRPRSGNFLNWTKIFKLGKDVEAITPIGTYIISFDSAGAGSAINLWLAGDDVDTFTVYDSFNEAKAVAQAHYDSIRKD